MSRPILYLLALETCSFHHSDFDQSLWASLLHRKRLTKRYLLFCLPCNYHLYSLAIMLLAFKVFFLKVSEGAQSQWDVMFFLSFFPSSCHHSQDLACISTQSCPTLPPCLALINAPACQPLMFDRPLVASRRDSRWRGWPIGRAAPINPSLTRLSVKNLNRRKEWQFLTFNCVNV